MQPPKRVGAGLAALALALSALWAPRAVAGPDEPRQRGDFPVVSLQEMRQANVVLQRWDLSCGSAALSTLLTYDIGDPVSEADIIKAILQRSDPVRIRSRQGFSLLDLKRFVESRGHRAEGYGRLDLKSLERLLPAIVPTRIGGYDHFVIVRAFQDGRVLMADPAYGNRTMAVEHFESLWPRRIAFVVQRREGSPPPPAPQPPPPPVVAPRVVRQLIAEVQP